MKRDKRFSTILAMLDEQEHVYVDQLAEHFDVSPETIRRDLSTMSEQGLLRKVYGGAVKFQAGHEDLVSQRLHENAEEKRSIAQYAVRFVEPGDSLFLNAGTTTAIFAKELARHVDNLFVITNSQVIAHELSRSKNKVYVTGGYYNGNEFETQGSTVIDQIRRFRADHAFLTVGTISAVYGLMDYRLEAAEIIQIMVRQARRTTVLANSSKLDQTALVSICDLDEIDRLVTEAMPSESLMQALDKAETQLHVSGLLA